MGFFLACFGFSKKRKRGKSVYRVLKEGQGQGTYEALVDSSLSNNLDIEGNDSAPHSDFGHKLNEQTVKIRKKVRFNLEVKTYEPLTADCDDVTSNEEESKQWSLTGVCQNHRYYNCRNSYDDDEELNYEDSDHDDPDYEDCEYYFHSDDDLGDDYYSVSDKEEHKGTADDYKARAEVLFKKLCNSFVDFHDGSHIDTQAATQRDQNSFKSDLSGIDNRHPLLTPVANQTQWKAIKEKVPQSRDWRKETEQRTRIPSRPSKQTHTFRSKPELAGLAVDASLSSWLNPMK